MTTDLGGVINIPALGCTYFRPSYRCKIIPSSFFSLARCSTAVWRDNSQKRQFIHRSRATASWGYTLRFISRSKCVYRWKQDLCLEGRTQSVHACLGQLVNISTAVGPQEKQCTDWSLADLWWYDRESVSLDHMQATRSLILSRAQLGRISPQSFLGFIYQQSGDNLFRVRQFLWTDCNRSFRHYPIWNPTAEGSNSLL